MAPTRFNVDEERFYPCPWGKDEPSVTTIIGQLAKPALIPWAAGKAVDRVRPFLEMLKAGLINISEVDIQKVLDDAKKEHKVKKEEAADVGTILHSYIGEYYGMLMRGSRPKESRATIESVVVGHGMNELTSGWMAFKSWDDEFQAMPSFIELPVYSRKGYAGTLDFFGQLKDKAKFLIDFKSASAIYDETSMQVAAYGAALLETVMDVDEIEGWGCLRLDKQTGIPEFREYSRDEILSAYERFIKLTEYWHLTNEWKQKVSAEKKEKKIADKKKSG